MTDSMLDLRRLVREEEDLARQAALARSHKEAEEARLLARYVQHCRYSTVGTAL
jgi:hypothetical protein